MSLNEFDVSPDVLACTLYPDGSYQDLALRGFSRDYILERTGKDVGYHNHKVARELTGVDRDVYRARYVAENRDMAFIEQLFSDIASGNNSVRFVCEQCGFGSPKHYSLLTLFANLGVLIEYKRVRGQGQKSVMRRGCLDKFGVENVFELPEYQAIAGDTRERKYGARYTLQHGSVLASDAMCKGGKSKAADRLYDMLIQCFGKNDVRREYSSVSYPHLCDFYVVSRDLYIELNGYCTHGPHWFNSDSEVDRDLLDEWCGKFIYLDYCGRNPNFYYSMIQTWTHSDVEKRQDAARNNLNYLVFWGPSLSDASLWFEHGCPDAQDWKYEYSWLYDKEDA